MSVKIKVAIAEDEAVFRGAVKKTLGLMDDCDLVGICENGKDALDLCLSNPPDVLLTDITMPKMDGIELIRSVLKRHPKIAPVVLTTHEDDDSIFEAFKAGAIGYLLKTSTPNEVVEAIRLAAVGEAKVTPKVAARLIADMRRPQTDNGNELGALSSREMEVLELVAQGMRNREIADRLDISEKTVKNHVSNILKVLQVATRTEAAMKAVKTKSTDR